MSIKNNIMNITREQVYDNEERVLKARVVLNNADGRLKPGMLVDVIAIELKISKL